MSQRDVQLLQSGTKLATRSGVAVSALTVDTTGTHTGNVTGVTSGTAARTNALQSATTTVNVAAATAPSSGQVLTATSNSTATWQTPSTTASLSQATNAIQSLTTTVNTSNATAPVAGQFLRATGASAATWQRFAVSGNIGNTGTKVHGPASMTTSKLATGSYRASFPAGFWNGTTSVTGMATIASAGAGFISITTASAAGDGSAILEWSTFNTSAVATDFDFVFIAMQDDA